VFLLRDSVTLCLRGEVVLASRTMLVMIAKDLLEILVCPACRQALEYRESPESLKCKQCHRVYAVKDDIPIMLVDEATVEG
jgi:LSD1 subclass zinc finger protein